MPPMKEREEELNQTKPSISFRFTHHKISNVFFFKRHHASTINIFYEDNTERLQT